MDDLEALCERLEQVAAAEENRLDDIGGRFESAGNDLLRRPVAAHGVDGDPRSGHCYGVGVSRGSTSRPLYVPQVGQT